ncbi:MAG TPA: M48 family metallopeptidase [Candidatus Acidoferrales bacterium]|nr:M48 family metallopeptidase [Candidatus Acidoferrales bacterium]
MTKLTLALSALALAMLFHPANAAAQASTAASSAAQQQAAPKAPSAATPAATPPAQAAAPQTVTSYTLPPDLYQKARHLSEIAFWGQIAVFIYSVVILLLILRWKLGPKYRDWAEKASSSKFVQGLIFSPLILASITILTIPGDIVQQWVSRKFGLSIQGWGSWTWDWTKSLMVTLIIGTILVTILYAVIRNSPRRWWFYFWLVSLPIIAALIFLQPLIIDPLFHKFEPLERKNPALTASLEKLVQRAGENIPPERIFWMGAAEKSTQLNAYVTGWGASKRIVVWDTTIAKMTTPQIVFVTGHEMGHYVLLHIPKEFVLLALVFLILFYLGYKWAGGMVARRGTGWSVRGVDEWASFPALFLLLTILSFVANPLTNAISRYFEHQADQYGLEITHELTPDSGQVAAQSFEVLGEVDLADPKPNAVDIFWFYDHPAIPDRIRYCLTYHPWAIGGQGEFVH